MAKAAEGHRDAARSFGWLAGARGFSALTGFGTLAILARLLGPSDFGILALVITASTFAQAVVENGVAISIVRNRDGSRGERTGALLLAAGIGLSLGAVLFLVRGPLARAFALPALGQVFAVGAVILAVRAAGVAAWSVLQVQGRFRAMSVGQSLSQMIFYAVPTIAMAAAGLGYWALVGGQLLYGVADISIALWLGRHAYARQPRLSGVREMINEFGVPSLNGLINWAAYAMPNIVIGHTAGVGALGIYSRASTLLGTFVDLFGTSLYRVFFPMLAGMQDDEERMRGTFLLGVDLVLPLAALLAVPVIVHSQLIIDVLLGPKWEAAAFTQSILFVGLVARLGYKLTESANYALGMFGRAVRRQTVFAGSVLAGVLLLGSFGANGVASAMCASSWIVFLVSIVDVSARLDIRLRRFGRPFAIALLAAGSYAVPALLVMSLSGGLGFWGQNIVGGMAGGVAALLMVLLSPAALIGTQLAHLREERLGSLLGRRRAMSAG